MKNKKTVLFISRNLPPLIGGMETLNFNIYKTLVDHTDLRVLGPKGVAAYIGDALQYESPVKPLWRYLLSSFCAAILVAFGKPIQIVFCGSGLTIAAGYVAKLLTRAKLVCYLHGLDLVADSLIYKFFFIPLIRRSDVVIVNSNFTKNLAAKIGVSPHKLQVLHPGVESVNLDDRQFSKKKFVEEYGLQDRVLLLIAGRITRRKGIVEFIQNCMPELLKSIPNIHLLVVGGEATSAIVHKSGITQEITETLSSLQLENHVFLMGNVSEISLHQAYCAADLLIFPVLNIVNDVEGFGMVAVEAAAHGLPTVAFSVGGIPDAIQQDKSGWLIESGDYPHMTSRILNYINSRQNISPQCVDHAKQFEWKNFSKKLTQILDL